AAVGCHLSGHRLHRAVAPVLDGDGTGVGHRAVELEGRTIGNNGAGIGETLGGPAHEKVAAVVDGGPGGVGDGAAGEDDLLLGLLVKLPEDRDRKIALVVDGTPVDRLPDSAKIEVAAVINGAGVGDGIHNHAGVAALLDGQGAVVGETGGLRVG